MPPHVSYQMGDIACHQSRQSPSAPFHLLNPNTPALSSSCPEPSTLTLFLKKQIRPTTPQINNLRTPIPILLQPRTLKAIKRITYSLSSTNHAFVLVVPERAFGADTDERCWTHVGVTDRTLAVAFVAEATDGDARGFATHYEISVETC